MRWFHCSALSTKKKTIKLEQNKLFHPQLVSFLSHCGGLGGGLFNVEELQRLSCPQQDGPRPVVEVPQVAEEGALCRLRRPVGRQ